jgi:hypothetical protein
VFLAVAAFAEIQPEGSFGYHIFATAVCPSAVAIEQLSRLPLTWTRDATFLNETRQLVGLGAVIARRRLN